MMATFSPEDLAILHRRGKSAAEVDRELTALRGPAHAVPLLRPCLPGDGVVRLSPAAASACAARFQDAAPQLHIVKFVAASGSATRMFEAFSQALAGGNPPESLPETLPRWAFYDVLADALAARGQNLAALLESGDWQRPLDFLLSPAGLDYQRRPKALIPYHRYPDGPRTALEEHLLEARGYARGAGGLVRSHFTVCERHRLIFQQAIQAACARFIPDSDSWAISTSVQDDSASTLLLDAAGDPVRDAAGQLQFASPGHGALLSNLNAIDADLIFIRTVDHVFPERLQPLFWHYKRVLGGCFLELRERVHGALRALSAGAPGAIASAESILRDELSVAVPDQPRHADESTRRRRLFALLHRPLRVCGVVPNEGRPGGAPFWTLGPGGRPRLRIVEGCEVDTADPRQRSIWGAAAYFNPVDIACSVRDYLGRPFRLSEFADPNACLQLSRMRNGRLVRILERPGLWNGGMAEWNTVFLEVPAATIHPVKTVYDLLDARHCV